MKNRLVQNINLNHPSETGLFRPGLPYFGRSARKQERRRQKRLLQNAATVEESAVMLLGDDSSDDESVDDEPSSSTTTASTAVVAAASATANTDKIADTISCTHNANFRRQLTYAITQRTSTDDEAVKFLLRASRYDVFGNNSRVPDANSRMNIIMGCDDLIVDRVLQEFYKRYKDTAHNPGNTKSHHSTSTDAMTKMDDILAPYVVSGAFFFVQARGSAKAERPTNPDGTQFVAPDDGTLIEAEEDSGKPDVLFELDKFVPGIAVGGLETRTREMQTEGKTNSRQCVKFTDYTVEVSDGIVIYKNRSFEHVNDENIALVRFVKRKKPKVKRGPAKSDDDWKQIYTDQYQETLDLFKSKEYNVDKLKQPECLVLLYKYGKFEKNRDTTSKQCKVWLKDYINGDGGKTLGFSLK